MDLHKMPGKSLNNILSNGGLMVIYYGRKKHKKKIRPLFFIYTLNTRTFEAPLIFLEDHPRYRKWLGSPPFISYENAIWKGNNPT